MYLIYKAVGDNPAQVYERWETFRACLERLGFLKAYYREHQWSMRGER